MKKFYALLFLVLMTLTTTLSAGLHAAESDNLITKADSVAFWSKYIKLKTDSFFTFSAYSIDYNLEPKHPCDSLKAGLEDKFIKVISKTYYESFPVPQPGDYKLKNSLRSMYGDDYMKGDNTDSIRGLIDDFVAGETPYGAGKAFNRMFSLDQGGVYINETLFDLIGYHHNDTIIIYDKPTIRLQGEGVVKVGSDINYTACFNTGYPYNLDEFTGEENMRVKVYRVKDKDNAVLINSIEKPFRVKGTERPLLAVKDTLLLNIKKPELGKYILTYESNWKALQPRIVTVDVIDTLRAEIKLDKKEYELANTKTAQVSAKMHYGYPFIQAVEPDTIPTIRMCSTISRQFKEKQGDSIINKRDTLLVDTFKIADQKFAKDTLNYEGSYTLDLSKIDQSRLTEGGDNVNVNIKVIFNGGDQYATDIPVRLIKDPNGSASISVICTEGLAGPLYSIDGRIIATPARNGIYIRNGKKVVIKE